LDYINYPQNIEEKLGFDKIKQFLKSECRTDLGRAAIDKIRFLIQQDRIHLSIRQIAEAGLCSQNGYILQLPENLEEVLSCLQQLDKEGMILYEDELQKIYLALVAMQNNFAFIKGKPEIFIELNNLQKHLTELSVPVKLLGAVLDKEGRIRPDASPELWNIHKKISAKEKDVRRILQSKFEMARKNGWAGDTEITIRNERLVIPIIAEFKKKIQGFVHDDSQSGKFLYIEPIECFEENNLLRELEFERKKEIEHILRQVTAQLSPYKQPIWQHTQHTIFLDVALAKSVFSGRISAREPIAVRHNDETNLVNARHPLLYMILQKDNKRPVPLNFNVRKDNCMVLISGPNAGGKSIALKTIGLLQYMYQCGMPVPLDEGSKMTVFHQVFIDIGDNQSIENNLSSYSSHLLNMKNFMERMDARTLYLIDELGNGTDPAIGSAIAQAILEVLLSKKGFGVITTHFGNLKAWANQTEAVQNARMLYDLTKLEPLFELELDKPGSSFALEVAGKVGIDKKIIDSARKINQWKQHIDLDELLAENEKNKMELADTNKRVQAREKVLERLIADYNLLKESLNDNKLTILNEAKSKATEIVSKANQRIEETIKVIKQSKADKEKTNKIRTELNTFKEEIKPLEKPKPAVKKVSPVSNKPLAVGSVVRHEDHPVSGEILKIKKDQAHVLFGHITMWVPLEQLYNSHADKKHIPKTATFNARLFEKQSTFRAELDLRGVRGEEAIKQLDDWVHDAHLLGMFTLKVVHGRGHGILRKLIIEHLRSINFVDSWEHETEQLGGDGVTVVKIH
jgi:DNA mismatch repair protein MutS2